MTVRARRHAPRAGPPQTGYLEFATGVRGTIADISDGGLRFTTSAPLAQKSQNYKFVFNRGGELTASLAWTNEAGTTGGLRFEVVSKEAHDEIRRWLERSWESRRDVGALASNRSETPNAAASAVILTEVNPAERKTSSPSRFGRPAPLLIPGTSIAAEAADLSSHAGHKRRTALVLLILLLIIAVSTAAAAHFYPARAHGVFIKAKTSIVRVFASR